MWGTAGAHSEEIARQLSDAKTRAWPMRQCVATFYEVCRLDHIQVIGITFIRNDRTGQAIHCVAFTDVHPADETRQPESGDLAKAAAIWNRSAWEFGLLAAERR